MLKNDNAVWSLTYVYDYTKTVSVLVMKQSALAWRQGPGG